METKKCFKCGEVKPLRSFYKHPQMKDGRVNKCKECNKRDVQENYRVNKDHYRKYDRERFKRPERKEQLKKYQLRRRKLYPEKCRARYLLSNAIRDGKVIRPDVCTRCDSTERIQGHHEDYSKPFDVIWLCFVCHRAEHGQEAEAF